MLQQTLDEFHRPASSSDQARQKSSARLMRTAITKSRILLCPFLLLLLRVSAAVADPPLIPDPDGRPGTLILAGGGEVPTAVPEQIRSAAGTEGRCLVISDAAADPESAFEAAREWLLNHDIPHVDRLRASEGSATPEDVEIPESVRAVWICGGQQSRLAGTWFGTKIDTALQQLLNRGGVVAGTSAGAAIMSRVMIESGKDVPKMATGWDLLPGGIVDQHFSERQRLPRLQNAVALHTGLFGLGIDESTAVMISGRHLEVVGTGGATIVLGESSDRAEAIRKIRNGQAADLTQLRRAALTRSAQPAALTFQGPNRGLSAGSLVIVGGGSMPTEIVDEFLQLAGGADARIVVLPTAVPRAQTETRIPQFLSDAGVAEITVLTQRGPEETGSEEFRSAFSRATGIWFGGGRQWNFVDAYEGTEAIAAFHAVLQRGGVIGGSSAGATIQGEYLVRGHPLGNTEMMAEGYERGFGFLPGTAIDQHFSQRQRQPDLLPVIRRHPQLIGLGIDEGTALVVQGSQGKVIGRHAVHFMTASRLQVYTADQPLPKEPNDAATLYRVVQSGESIDLSSLNSTSKE